MFEVNLNTLWFMVAEGKAAVRIPSKISVHFEEIKYEVEVVQVGVSS